MQAYTIDTSIVFKPKFGDMLWYDYLYKNIKTFPMDWRFELRTSQLINIFSNQ